MCLNQPALARPALLQVLSYLRRAFNADDTSGGLFQMLPLCGYKSLLLWTQPTDIKICTFWVCKIQFTYLSRSPYSCQIVWAFIQKNQMWASIQKLGYDILLGLDTRQKYLDIKNAKQLYYGFGTFLANSPPPGWPWVALDCRLIGIILHSQWSSFFSWSVHCHRDKEKHQ